MLCFNNLFPTSGSKSRERERESKRLCRFVKILYSFFLFVTLFFTVHSSVYAATYYVATTGNDSRTTAEAQNPSTPWLTLNHAELTATNNDTVNVATGTYVEDDPSTHGWSVSKAITWVASGSVIVRGTSTSTRPLYIQGTGTASYSGFTFDAEGTRSYSVYFKGGTANKSFSSCTFMGATSSLIIPIPTVSNITISSSTFNVTAGSAISGSWSGLTINNNSTFNVTGARLISTTNDGADDISIIDSSITATITADLFDLNGSGNYTITGNTISLNGTPTTLVDLSRSGTTGTFIFSSNVATISSVTSSKVINIFNDSWTTTLQSNNILMSNTSQAQDIFYLNNQVSPIISGNTIETTTVNPVSHINLSSSGTNGGTINIKNNTLKSRSTTGYIVLVGADGTSAGDNMFDNATIEENTIYGALYYDSTLSGVSTHSIMYGFNKNGTIRYNTVIGGGYGIVLKDNGDVNTDGGVYYNKFINTGKSYAAVRVKGIKGIKVYNNDFYMNESFTNTSRLIQITENGAGESATGTLIKNNIFYGDPTYSISVEAGSITSFESDYNIFYRYTSGDTNNANATAYNFSAWQGLGYDTHSINSNPLFQDTSTNNFVLQRASPAREVATNLNFSRDFINTSVPQGSAPDIGAYEYIPLTVTINQATGQIDPTTNSTVNYTVVFSESVSDFTTGDVTLSGTAGATTATITGSGTTYDVAVTGMTGSGTISASITVDKTTGATSNTNDASTSTDNSVTYDVTGPIISAVSTGTPTSTGATITWTTNEDASSKVDFGLTSAYGTSTTETDTLTGVTAHSVILPDLSSCTTYHYRIRSKDALLNESIGSDNSLTTTGCSTSNNSESSSSVSSSTSTPNCNDSSSAKPELFQVDIKGTSAKLFFTPLQDTNKFYVSFSTKSNAEEHGVEVVLAKEGVQNYTINALKPNANYYFKIRGQNGCMPGQWSNIVKVTSKSVGINKTISYYMNSLKTKVASVFQVIKLLKVKTTPTNTTTIESTPQITPSPKEATKSEAIKQPVKKQTCILWWCW